MSNILEDQIIKEEQAEFDDKTFTSRFFRGYTFRYNIVKCVFKDCRFHNCRFDNITISGDSFFNDNLFQHCEFSNTVFENADIDTNYRIINNIFRACHFKDLYFKCNLKNCNLEYRYDSTFEPYPQSLYISSIILDSCEIINYIEDYREQILDIRGSTFNSCILRSNCFRNISMNGFEFRRTRFISCDISETDMRDNDMRFVQFNTCNLQGSLFNNSILNNTDITRCNITDANFFGVDDNFIHDLEQRSDLNNTGHFIREPILDEDGDEEAMEQHEEYGIAFEIHNAFHKLDQSKLIEFINSARETKPFTLLPIDNNSMRFSTTLNSVLTDEIHLVFSTDLDTRSRLLTRLPILIGQIEDIPFTRDILALAILTISFAKSISTEFYKTYITLFIDDSFEAYGNRGSIDASCPKGIIERIVFSLYTASIVECPDITSIEVCQEPYKSLIKIIGPAMPVHLDFNGLTKEWFENFSHKVTGKTEEERVKNRKNSYIEFMSSKLKILVSNTPENNDRIAKDADNFETAGLFSDDNISDYQEAGMIILPLRYF